MFEFSSNKATQTTQHIMIVLSNTSMYITSIKRVCEISTRDAQAVIHNEMFDSVYIFNRYR